MRRSLLVTGLTMLAITASACGGSKADDRKKNAAAVAPRDVAVSPTATPHKVVVLVDRKKLAETMTIAGTVREVLAQVHIPLGKYDLVTPAADQAPAATIKVVRLLSAPKTTKVTIPPPTVEKKDSKLPAFSRKVTREGRSGLKMVTTAYVRRHGKKVKAVIDQKVKRKPVSRIVSLGPQSGGGGAAARLNWAALAKCESGGNPAAVNPAGYYGLYQFNRQSWATVGGSGLPSQAPAAEQTYRAQLLYNRVNGRWQGQWPNCGHFLFS
ncbi:transglycosylase family protein [Actinoallomurus purpureus]|uniref:transglycosylase family protein n=1 Tax=Actinoallomurus purpureus TaxID=478114 RepID=UPI0020932F07|nr:resuscitation-promoting factor [Actinoallomurus purpureus]MCO6010512.1 transglycosylase family protein [Actinoallomurus purpureus]